MGKRVTGCVIPSTPPHLQSYITTDPTPGQVSDSGREEERSIGWLDKILVELVFYGVCNMNVMIVSTIL